MTGALDLPFGSPGTLLDIDKFDAEYFNYSTKTADTLEPTHRMLLEVSYEAIVDAGMFLKNSTFTLLKINELMQSSQAGVNLSQLISC